MNYLLLSILFSSLIFTIFKWMGRLSLKTFIVILINYFVAALFGFAMSGSEFSIEAIFFSDWILPAITLGCSFIFVFNLMATTTQKYGTSTAVVSNKMSLVIPVLVALWFFNESVTIIKVTGIVLAILGVVFTMKRKDQPLENLSSYQPVLLFFLSGIIDLSMKLIQQHFLNDSSTLLFVPVLFLFAFITGVLFLLIKKGIKKVDFSKKTLGIGLLLGVINYFSIYFLVMALAVKNLESSVVFPLNNIGIVLLATILGLFLLKEKLLLINKVGIVVSIFAIVLISMGK